MFWTYWFTTTAIWPPVDLTVAEPRKRPVKALQPEALAAPNAVRSRWETDLDVLAGRVPTALPLLAVPVAIVCNVVRVTGLTLMVHFWGTDLLATSLHEGSGLVSFAAAVGALFWIAGRDALRPAKA